MFTPPDIPTQTELPTFDQHFEWIKAFFVELQDAYPGMSPAEILSMNDNDATAANKSKADRATHLRQPMPKNIRLASCHANGSSQS